MKRCLPNKRAGHQISHYPPNFLRQCKRVIPFDKHPENKSPFFSILLIVFLMVNSVGSNFFFTSVHSSGVDMGAPGRGRKL